MNSKLMNKYLRHALIFLIVVMSIIALNLRFQNLISLMNYQFILPLQDAQINLAESNGSPNILFVGHVYGDPNQDNPLIPSETLINSVDELNRYSPGLIILMGDLSKIAGKAQWDMLEETFLSKVNAPVINAPGNHDLVNRKLYQERFGQTFYSTNYQNSLIIILDSVIDHCYIKDFQYLMLKKAVKRGINDSEFDRILIISHHLIYLVPPDPLVSHVNVHCRESNFSKLYDDIFLSAANEKPIYIFSGDVGAGEEGGSLSPYYYKDPNTNLYTIAVGLGNGEYDKVLLAEPSDSQLNFQVIPLKGGESFSIESYNPDYWLNYYSEYP